MHFLWTNSIGCRLAQTFFIAHLSGNTQFLVTFSADFIVAKSRSVFSIEGNIKQLKVNVSEFCADPLTLIILMPNYGFVFCN